MNKIKEIIREMWKDTRGALIGIVAELSAFFALLLYWVYGKPDSVQMIISLIAWLFFMILVVNLVLLTMK